MIPHITIEQYSAAFQIKDTEPEHVKTFVLNTYNERIDKANEHQESYITADEARELKEFNNSEKANALAKGIFPDSNYEEKIGKEIGKLVRAEIEKYLADPDSQR